MAAPTMATTTTTSNNSNKSLLLLLLLVPVVLALLPLGALSSRAGPPTHPGAHGHKPSAPPSTAVPALVRATCNSTAYYDVCVSALAADPSSATADVRGLSAIAVSAAAVDASGGAATAAALLADGDGALQARLLRACAARYGQARDALSAARDSIVAEQDYDHASVHVSAAAEYPQVCKALFRRQRPGAYPAELAAREEALARLCSVALDVIALLSNTPATN